MSSAVAFEQALTNAAEQDHDLKLLGALLLDLWASKWIDIVLDGKHTLMKVGDGESGQTVPSNGKLTQAHDTLLSALRRLADEAAKLQKGDTRVLLTPAVSKLRSIAVTDSLGRSLVARGLCVEQKKKKRLGKSKPLFPITNDKVKSALWTDVSSMLDGELAPSNFLTLLTKLALDTLDVEQHVNAKDVQVLDCLAEMRKKRGLPLEQVNGHCVVASKGVLRQS